MTQGTGETGRMERAMSNNFITTFTGRYFDIVQPRAEHVEIEDIAHALSIEPRFGGHTVMPYSVAEHCVLVTRLVASEVGYKSHWKPTLMWALLHDASEAYIKDIPRPLKDMMPEYKAIERRVMGAVIERFGMLSQMPVQVKEADDEMLKREAQNLFMRAPEWVSGLKFDPGPWRPFDAVGAKAAFLKMFHKVSAL